MRIVVVVLNLDHGVHKLRVQRRVSELFGFACLCVERVESGLNFLSSNNGCGLRDIRLHGWGSFIQGLDTPAKIFAVEEFYI